MTFSLAMLPRYAVMGILNVTPDSFSDGGAFEPAAAAIAHGHSLDAAGAAVVDVGGESTRPGAEPVDAETERARVLPVVAALAGGRAIVSIDTTKAVVADAALRAGATLVNDVSAARFDADMLDVVAEHDAGIVLTHMQGEPRTMQDHPQYDDVVAEVGEHLAARVQAALAAGVRRDAILVDPGIGFGKNMTHNLTLLRHLDIVQQRAGAPLVVGASRKRFLGTVVDESGAIDLRARDDATLATTVHAFSLGVHMVRVHDAAPSVRAAQLLELLHDADFGEVAS
ncbi:MAG TPA: dihydropteroate synthase [Acidimicrobiia bacterium]